MNGISSGLLRCCCAPLTPDENDAGHQVEEDNHKASQCTCRDRGTPNIVRNEGSHSGSRVFPRFNVQVSGCLQGHVRTWIWLGQRQACARKQDDSISAFHLRWLD